MNIRILAQDDYGDIRAAVSMLATYFECMGNQVVVSRQAPPYGISIQNCDKTYVLGHGLRLCKPYRDMIDLYVKRGIPVEAWHFTDNGEVTRIRQESLFELVEE